MKSLINLSTTASLLVALMGVHARVHASPMTTYSSTICSPPTAVTAFERISTGIVNTGTGQLNVFCPVVRTREPGTAGYIAHVNGRQLQGTTLACAFVNFRNDGFSRELQAFSPDAPATLGGVVRLTARLTTVEPGGYQHITCSIPPGGKLYGIELEQ